MEPVAVIDAISQSALMREALRSGDERRIALAGTIDTARAHGLPAGLWLRGLDDDSWRAMLTQCFPATLAAEPALLSRAGVGADEADEEFVDLLQLLLEAAAPGDAPDSDYGRWLASAIASASLFDNHLWQDLQLPNRGALSRLLDTHFTALARRNTGNMRWKNFFYKQLCDRAGMVCRAPSCGACSDYAECFGSEDVAQTPLAPPSAI